jgi:NitT/TauT family transport system ATP-binding protein
MKTLRIGYIPLVDAAVLIAAARRGFAEAEGLDIELVREVSWANIRDKLILDMLDATHMLAPLAIATSLGLGHVRVPLSVPFVLNFNGNGITLAMSHYRELAEVLGHEPKDAREASAGVRVLIDKRRTCKGEPLTFGVVFPFSIHSILIRHWLRLGGIRSDEVQFVVVPPPYMSDSLSRGLIDGFCVGNPWNSRAVESGVGAIVAFGSEIARRGPDKVLALTERNTQRDPDMVARLVRALHGAASWCEEAKNRKDLARLLAEPDHLNVPASLIEVTLEGRLRLVGSGWRADPDFFVLGREGASRPDVGHALWLYAELARAGLSELSGAAADRAASVYRPELFDNAIGEVAARESSDPVGLRFGPAFQRDDLAAYIAALDA